MIGKILLFAALLVLPVMAGPVKLTQLGTQITGKPELTQEDLEGKLLVAHLWEAHCGSCKRALPAFEKEMRGKKKYAVAVILHYYDERELAESVAKDLRLKVPVFDGGRKLPQFKPKSWPCVLIVSPEGKVLYNGEPGRDFEKALRQAKKDLP